MFVVGVIVLCFLIGSTIALKYEVKSSSQEYLVRTSYQKSGCTDAPYSLLGETLNQCIRSTNPTTASYKYVNGSKEGEIIQYHWATSATCSGNPAYSTLSIPTECGSGYYTTLSYTNESPPWSGYKPGFLFQTFYSNSTCQAGLDFGVKFTYYPFNVCISTPSTSSSLSKMYTACKSPQVFVRYFSDSACQTLLHDDDILNLPCLSSADKKEYTSIVCI